MNAIGWCSCCGFLALLLGYGYIRRRCTARRSGWAHLSARYPADLSPAGTRFGRVSASINGQEYRDHLTVWVSGTGLRLGVQPIFRSAHRPILVPWDDITPEQTLEGGDLVLSIGESAKLIVRGSVARGVRQILSRRSRGRKQTWQA